MNSSTPEPAKPDVESVIAEIRTNSQAAENSVPGALRQAVEAEDHLQAQLAEANRTCITGQSISGWRKWFLRPLNPWRSDVNHFNSSVVRVLNRLVKLLEGADLPETGPLLDQQRRRMTLTEKLSDRMADYDRLELDARIRTLEDKIARLEKEREG